MNTNEIMSRDDLLTNCERSMRYHQARTRFYNSSHLFIQFVVFVFTTTAAAFIIKEFSREWVGLGLLAAMGVLALLSLVWNPADKSCLHKILYRDFTTLAGNIAATAKANEATRTEWTRAIHALYAQEPPTFRALNALCYNQVSIALDQVNDGHYVDLKRRQLWLRNWCKFHGSDFSTRKQLQQQARTKVKTKAARAKPTWRAKSATPATAAN